MAKGRMLNGSISTSGQVADLEGDTHRLLFTWAIAHLDKEGRVNGDPREFKAKVCPMLDHLAASDVGAALVDMIERRLVVAYLDGKGQRTLFFPGFKSGQTGMHPDREAESKFTEPVTGVEILQGLVPPWLSAYSGKGPEESGNGPSEWNGMEQNGKEKKGLPSPDPLRLTQGTLALVPSEPTKPSPAETVFAAYLAEWKRCSKGHRAPVLTDARRKLANARLKEFSAADLALACRGIWLSRWNVDNHQTSFDLAMRDAAHVERFIAIAENANEPGSKTNRRGDAIQSGRTNADNGIPEDYDVQAS